MKITLFHVFIVRLELLFVCSSLSVCWSVFVLFCLLLFAMNIFVSVCALYYFLNLLPINLSIENIPYAHLNVYFSCIHVTDGVLRCQFYGYRAFSQPVLLSRWSLSRIYDSFFCETILIRTFPLTKVLVFIIEAIIETTIEGFTLRFTQECWCESTLSAECSHLI